MKVKDIKPYIRGSKYKIMYEDDLKWFFKLMYDEMKYSIKPTEEEENNIKDDLSHNPITNTYDLSRILSLFIETINYNILRQRYSQDINTYFDEFEVNEITASSNGEDICIWVEPINL